MNGLPLTLLKTACIGTFLIGLAAAAASVPALAGPWTLLMEHRALARRTVPKRRPRNEARILSAIGGGRHLRSGR
jgi:hypothetical protein